jgi:hypothetical protein
MLCTFLLCAYRIGEPLPLLKKDFAFKALFPFGKVEPIFLADESCGLIAALGSHFAMPFRSFSLLFSFLAYSPFDFICPSAL